MINWDDTFKIAQSLSQNTHLISHKYCCIMLHHFQTFRNHVILESSSACLTRHRTPQACTLRPPCSSSSSRGLLSVPHDIPSHCRVHGSSRMPGQCPAIHLESFFCSPFCLTPQYFISQKICIILWSKHHLCSSLLFHQPLRGLLHASLLLFLYIWVSSTRFNENRKEGVSFLLGSSPSTFPVINL